MTRHAACPRCEQPTTLLKSGDMRDHRTANCAIGQARGGRVRELCPYSGVTPDEARAGVTPLRRLLLQRDDPAGGAAGARS